MICIADDLFNESELITELIKRSIYPWDDDRADKSRLSANEDFPLDLI